MKKKRILITGKNSFIGQSFINWMSNLKEQYFVEAISVRGEEWKEHDFSVYDCVLHLAGIAHVSSNPKMEELYYKVNRDLAIEVAKKAKCSGVGHFIFMSTIKVYGDNVNKTGTIGPKTKPRPTDFYGKSKLQAEEGINRICDQNFKVAIIRPPMIFGKGSRGNYPRLSKLAKKTPIFPNIENQRSMLHIDNLCEFLRIIIKNNETGIFFPQNKEYVNTSEMVKIIAELHGRNVRLTKLFNIFIIPFINKINTLNKVFGNLIYEKNMSEYKEEYQIRSLKDSIKNTELF